MSVYPQAYGRQTAVNGAVHSADDVRPSPNGRPLALDKQLRLLVAACGDEDEKTLAYGRELSARLNATTTEQAEADFAALLATGGADCDLVLLGEPRRSWLSRWLFGDPAWAAAEKLSCSVLAARRPRWPVREILTILRGEPNDEAAVNWALRLAAVCEAHLTLLPIVPSQPGFYNQGRGVQAPLRVLLTADSPVGHNLRRQLLRLNQSELPGRMESYEGPPEEQIEKALQAHNPDLIVVAAEPHGRFMRFWLGEIVRPLLRRTDRPVLTAKAAYS
jgi:nucleotide-binding universal stress UspA family protein